MSTHEGVLGAVPGTVTRTLRVGFEVRLTVATDTDGDVTVVVTRATARHLGLEEGSQVWLSANRGAGTLPQMAGRTA